MGKRFWQYGSIALAAILLAAPARAATVIDFSSGSAGLGGWITWEGGQLTGRDVPVGSVTIVGAPTGNGTYQVNGSALGTGSSTPAGSHLFGDLDFRTGPGSFISLAGCIPGLSLGTLDAAGNCVDPITFLTGSIEEFDRDLAFRGLVSASGVDTKSPQLLAALGLPANTPFEFFGFSLVTPGLGPSNPTSPAVSTDIINSQVPEPTTLMLFGTGLLALCRKRRRTV